MILDTTLTVTRPTRTRTDEGLIVNTYSTYAVIRANVQPANLSQDQLKVYGISELSSTVKKVFSKVFGWKSTDRFAFGPKTFEVRGVSTWGNHEEALAVEVES